MVTKTWCGCAVRRRGWLCAGGGEAGWWLAYLRKTRAISVMLATGGDTRREKSGAASRRKRQLRDGAWVPWVPRPASARARPMSLSPVRAPGARWGQALGPGEAYRPGPKIAPGPLAASTAQEGGRRRKIPAVAATETADIYYVTAQARFVKAVIPLPLPPPPLPFLLLFFGSLLDTLI